MDTRELIRQLDEAERKWTAANKKQGLSYQEKLQLGQQFEAAGCIAARPLLGLLEECRNMLVLYKIAFARDAEELIDMEQQGDSCGYAELIHQTSALLAKLPAKE